MNQVDRLIANYRNFVRLPWPSNLAGRQRIWFAIYPPPEERRVRAKIREFELATNEANHKWHLIDITHAPARWLASHDYQEAYFAEPAGVATIEDELKGHVVSQLRSACQEGGVDRETVVAVIGVGSLFGFTHVSPIVSEVEDFVQGRLLVFFPGEYERSVYRFMDARDGFNYMAVPITCSERWSP